MMYNSLHAETFSRTIKGAQVATYTVGFSRMDVLFYNDMVADVSIEPLELGRAATVYTRRTYNKGLVEKVSLKMHVQNNLVSADTFLEHSKQLAQCAKDVEDLARILSKDFHLAVEF